MRRRLFAAVSFVLVLSSSAIAAEESSPNLQQPSPLVVRLRITGDDDLQKRFSECLVTELQKDPGLKIGETRDAITFDVIIVRQKLSNGELLGYLLYLGGYLPAPQNADHPDPRESQAVLIQWQTVRMSPPDLTAACHRAARDFGGEVIRPVRSTLKSFSESLDRQGRP